MSQIVKSSIDVWTCFLDEEGVAPSICILIIDGVPVCVLHTDSDLESQIEDLISREPSTVAASLVCVIEEQLGQKEA